MKRIAISLIMLLVISSINVTNQSLAVFGATSNSINTVSIVTTNHKFTESDASLLRIEEKYKGEFGVSTQTFTIQLDNAIWNDDANEGIENYMADDDHNNKGSVGISQFHIEVEQLDDETMEIDLTLDNTSTDTLYVKIPMLCTTINEGSAQISIDGKDSILSGGTYTFANVTDAGSRPNYIVVDKTIKRTAELPENTKVTEDDRMIFFIEEDNEGDFMTQTHDYYLELDNGIWDSNIESIMETYIESNYSKLTNSMNIDAVVTRTSDQRIDFTFAFNEKTVGEEAWFRVPLVFTSGTEGTINLEVPSGTYRVANVKQGIDKTINDLYVSSEVNVHTNVLKDIELAIDQCPNVRIKEKNIGDFGSHTESINLTITNAIWQTGLEAEIENYIKNNSSGNIDVTVLRTTDNTLNVAFSYDEIADSSRHYFKVPLVVKTTTEGQLKLDISGNSLLTYGEVFDKFVNASISKTSTFASEEYTLGEIKLLENQVTGFVFEKNEKLLIILPQGFEWINKGTLSSSALLEAEITSEINGNTMTITFLKKDSKPFEEDYIKIIGASIKAQTGANEGNVSISFDGAHFDVYDLKVGIFELEKKSGSSNSSSSGGGGGSAPKKKTTEDKVKESLNKGDEVILDFSDELVPESSLSKETLDKLVETKKPFIIDNGQVVITLTAQDIKMIQEKSTKGLLVEATNLNDEDAKKIYDNSLFNTPEKLIPIGDKIFKINVEGQSEKSDKDNSSKLTNPVAITINLKDQKLSENEIAKLSGVRYETNEFGELVLVKCGGNYDIESGTFTFFTDEFGECGVVKDENLKKMSLFIDDTYTILNDQNDQLDTAPEIINNRTMVPLRYIAESLGAGVEWNADTQTITMNKEGKTITLTIGKTTDEIDAPAMIKNSRTMVPVRYISEQFGANVMWFEDAQKIEIIQ